MIFAVTGLGSRIGQLQREEDRRVDDERRCTDDRELDELVMPVCERPERAREPRNRGISERHKKRVYVIKAPDAYPCRSGRTNAP